MKLILYIAVFYFGLALYAQFVVNQVIFLKPEATYEDTEEIIKLKSADGAILSAIYLHNPDAEYTVLYSQGNYSEIGRFRPFLNNFKENGFSILTYDYQGYGTSTGKPTEKNSYHAIDAAYQYLINVLKIPPEKILAYGHSLGAAVSLDLATRKPLGGLILESPFLSAFRVYTQIPLLPFDRYNNAKKVTKISMPLMIIHGTDDNIILPWHSKSLYKRAKVPKMLYLVEGADHNNLISIAGKAYFEKINEFLSYATKGKMAEGQRGVNIDFPVIFH